MLRDDVNAEALPAEEEIDGYRLLRLNVPRYLRANDKRRILAWFVFACKLLVLHKRLRVFPDVVVYSSPHPIGYLGAEFLASVSAARLVFEVRDIWPLTLVQIGGYSQRHPFVIFLKWIEDRAYSRSDHVLSNLEGVRGHMATRGLDSRKFTHIPNGVALDEFQSSITLSPKFAAQIPAAGFRIVYMGTFGSANALNTLIKSAALIQDLEDVTILLVGKGRERVQLEAKCRALGLNNVRFLAPVVKSQVQSVIALCDACYIGWQDLPLYRYGIAPNKMSEYLYAGKPILHSYSGAFDPVVRFGAGFTVPAEDPQALAHAIRRLRDMSELDRQLMGENGRRAALEFFDYAKLTRSLERVLVDRSV